MCFRHVHNSLTEEKVKKVASNTEFKQETRYTCYHKEIVNTV